MKKAIAIILLFCILIGMTACSATKSDTQSQGVQSSTVAPETTTTEATQQTASTSLRIAFSNTVPGMFQTAIEETIKAWCDEKGYDFTVTYNNGDSTKALSDIQTYINSEYDYVLCYVLDEGTQESIRKMAEGTKTTVVFMGLELDGYTTIAGGNYEGSYNVGEKLWNKVQSLWNGEFDLFVLMEATSYGEINTQRTSGVIDSFCKLSKYAEKDIVRLDYDDVLKAQSAFATMLAAHPDDKRIVVYGVTDANQTIGAWNAACAAGREKELIISGVHVADEATPGLLTKYPDIWIGQSDPMGQGYGNAFIQFIEGFQAGKDLTGTTISSKQTWVDASNVADYYTVK